jgi:methylmalonyl-CoA/ethylmalonyl-CoA epimerase
MLPDLIFHHIGILTASIKSSLPLYENAGFTSTDIVYDPIQDVHICFSSKTGEPLLELIEPASEQSKVIATLQKKGPGPYHTCYETSHLSESIQKLKKMNFILISKPEVAVALDQRLICFLFHKEIGLIELVETK